MAKPILDAKLHPCVPSASTDEIYACFEGQRNAFLLGEADKLIAQMLTDVNKGEANPICQTSLKLAGVRAWLLLLVVAVVAVTTWRVSAASASASASASGCFWPQLPCARAQRSGATGDFCIAVCVCTPSCWKHRLGSAAASINRRRRALLLTVGPRCFAFAFRPGAHAPARRARTYGRIVRHQHEHTKTAVVLRIRSRARMG
jgi:hypothetical protein